MRRAAGLLGLVTVLGLGVGAAVGAGAHTEVARPPTVPQSNPAYDGRFAFVRLRYGDDDGGMRGGMLGYGRGRPPMWSHDTPRAETNLLRIIQELTSVQTVPGHHLVLDTDDPELFRYPVAYIVEVGYWFPTESEVTALRDWLLKGGFLIVDDFRAGHLNNFLAQMRRVLPGAEFRALDGREEVFDSFFHIADPHSLIPPYERELVPMYLGLFEDDDPDRRLMVIANYNNDLAEYWEFSDYGYYPIDLSNEAYKFGVNYVIYGLTH